jgi:hypothetical protein
MTFSEQILRYEEIINGLEDKYHTALEQEEETVTILHEIKGYTYFMDQLILLNELIDLNEGTDEELFFNIVMYNLYLDCECDLERLIKAYKVSKGNKKEEVPMIKEVVPVQQKSDEWYAAMLHTRYIHYKLDPHKTSYKKGKDTVFITIKHDGVTFDLCEKTASGWKRLSRSVKPLGQALLLNIMQKSKTFKKYVIETENSK